MNKYDILAEKIRASRQNIRQALQGEYTARESLFSNLVSQKEQEQRALQELKDRPKRKIEDLAQQQEEKKAEEEEEKKGEVVVEDDEEEDEENKEDFIIDFNLIDTTNKVSLKNKGLDDLYVRRKTLDDGNVSVSIFQKQTKKGSTDVSKDIPLGNIMTDEDGLLRIIEVDDLEFLTSLLDLIKNKRSRTYLRDRIELAGEKLITGRGLENNLKLLLGSYLAKNNSPQLLKQINYILEKLNKNKIF